MKLDFIPIYEGEMLPTKDMWFHTEGKIPVGVTNAEDFRNRMIEGALHSNYLSGCNCVIVLENGKVIKTISGNNNDRSVEGELNNPLEELRKNMFLLGKRPVKIKMKERYYHLTLMQVARVASTASIAPIERFNGIPLEIDNKIEKDFEVVYE